VGDVFVLGVGMTRFGKHPDRDATDLGVEASFPDRLAFNASAESDSPITRLRLRYAVAGSQ